MALVLADRVKETSNTTGTGTYTLAGAVTGFETFGAIGNGNTTYYACTDNTDFEVGIGTYTSSGTTLARTTILQSSNSDNAVSWGSGTKTLFCTQPAEKAVFLDASGDVAISRDTNASAEIGRAHVGYMGFSDLAGFSHVDQNSTTAYALLQNSSGATFLNSKSGQSLSFLINNSNVAYVNTTGLNLNTGYNLRFEGATPDNFETVLTVEDPTVSDKTITLPNATGTVLLTDGDGSSLTNVNATTLDSVDSTSFLRSDAADTKTSGNLTLSDDVQLRAGDGGDLRIYHDASNSYVDQNDATLFIRNTSETANASGNAIDIRNADDTGIEIPNNSGVIIKRNGNTSVSFTSVGAFFSTDIVLNGNTHELKFRDTSAGNFYLTLDAAQITDSDKTITLPNSTGTVSLLTNTETLTNKTLTTPVINGFSGTGDGSITGDLTVTSTDDSASTDPQLILYRNSSSPATSDNIGEIIFKGNNSTDGETANFAQIEARNMGNANNLEHGGLSIKVLRTGSELTVADFNYFEVRFKEPVKLDEDVSITFEGSSSNSHETVLDVINPTQDNSINLPDASGTVLLADGAIDTDASAEIGRAHIGNVGFSDFAGFSHVDTNATGTYALLQSATGQTFINGASGQYIKNRINNVDIMTVNASGVFTEVSTIIDGDGSSGGVTISDGNIDIRTGTGSVSKVKFYCESSNAHAQTLQGAPHANGSSAVLVLPDNSGTLVGTGDSGTVATGMIANDAVTADKLANTSVSAGSYTNSSITVDAQGRLTAASSGSSSTLAFKTISASGQDDVVADSATDTLTFVAGSNMTIATNASNDSITFTAAGGTSGISNVVDDSTPQLGGDLDVAGNAIVSASNGNIAITPNGSGKVILDGLSYPSSDGSANQVIKTDGSGNLSFATVSGGGSGISDIVEDTTPQLGGNLDLNSKTINGTGTINFSGALSATTKSFDIKHPTKEGHRLRYGSLEGAENGVYYRGQTDLDYIELPEHWIGLVDEKSITVQLTPKGKFQQLFVRDIEDLTVIVNGVEGDYYFLVFAERKDVDKLVVEYEG